MKNLQELNEIKWASRLLTVLIWFYGAAATLFSLALIQPPKGMGYAIVAVIALFMALMAYLIYRTKQNLLMGKKRGWIGAIIFSAMFVLSILLPLAVLSLRQLLADQVVERFNKKPKDDEGLNEAYLVPKQEPLFSTTAKLVLSFVLVACVGLYFSFRGNTSTEFVVNKNLSLQQLVELGAECNTSGNMICSEAVFARMLELLPTDRSALANLAMAKSNLGKHKEAIDLFADYFLDGGGALDAMYYYGRSLEAVGNMDMALKWYQLALKVNPDLLDVTESTVKILVKQKQLHEALMLIDNIVKKHPQLKTYFKGQKDVILSQMEVSVL